MRPARREVFEAERQIYYVTRHRAHLVDGIFAGQALRGHDGEEIDNMSDFLLPLVIANIEKRIRRRLRIDELSA